VGYTSKKELKAAIGQPLKYEETSFHGLEYKADGEFSVAHRPSLNKSAGREFFARVTMKAGLIAKVE
jgi:hypothetical protein